MTTRPASTRPVTRSATPPVSTGIRPPCSSSLSPSSPSNVTANTWAPVALNDNCGHAPRVGARHRVGARFCPKRVTDGHGRAASLEQRPALRGGHEVVPQQPPATDTAVSCSTSAYRVRSSATSSQEIAPSSSIRARTARRSRATSAHSVLGPSSCLVAHTPVASRPVSTAAATATRRCRRSRALAVSLFVDGLSAPISRRSRVRLATNRSTARAEPSCRPRLDEPGDGQADCTGLSVGGTELSGRLLACPAATFATPTGVR